MKKSFGIMTALFILVLVSFLLMLVLKASSIGVKHASDTYIKEQAELFMQSSIENAILAIEGYERNSTSKCLKNIYFTSSDGRFEANISVLRYYCYDKENTSCKYCDNGVNIETSKSNGNVVLYTIIQTTSSPRNGDKKLRFSKVTIQKP